MVKIAVIGKSLPPFDEIILDKARQIGVELAKKSCIVVSGGCRGYPYEASLAAFVLTSQQAEEPLDVSNLRLLPVKQKVI